MRRLGVEMSKLRNWGGMAVRVVVLVLAMKMLFAAGMVLIHRGEVSAGVAMMAPIGIIGERVVSVLESGRKDGEDGK